MKNIHILPTDKPSKLFEILQFNLLFDSQNMYSEEYKKLHKYKNKNIYITSDEEIKEGDCYFNNTGSAIERLTYKLPSGGSFCKKIILTTDQDLIKDGVQAIDDEFLEWFVKNPSCESIKTERFKIIYHTWIYKIIIPKEEPKQETLEEAAENYANYNEQINKAVQEAVKFGAKWQQEQDKKLYSEEDMREAYKWGRIYDMLEFDEWFEQFKNK